MSNNKAHHNKDFLLASIPKGESCATPPAGQKKSDTNESYCECNGVPDIFLAAEDIIFDLKAALIFISN